MKELVGQQILWVYKNEDSRYVVFICAYHIYVYEFLGECCSQSYLHAISYLDNLIGSEIISVEERPEIRSDDSWSIDYGYTIGSTKGYADIEFRNESNGYYGGSCELVKLTVYYKPDGQKTISLSKSADSERTIILSKFPDLYLDTKGPNSNDYNLITLKPYKEDK